MTRSHAFDNHLEIANRWLKEFAENLDLPRTELPRALHALRAGLHAIRDRLPPTEVLDLAAQLPTLIRGFYYEGWTLAPKRLRDRSAMLARLKAELAPEQRLDPVDVLRATIHLLVEHVTEGEISDVVATLPKPIATLWHELAAHALVTAPPPSHALTRRTGYSR